MTVIMERHQLSHLRRTLTIMIRRWIGCSLLFVSLSGALCIQGQTHGDRVSLSPDFDELVPPSSHVEQVADGFGFLEGPVWVRKGKYLLFSDIPGNVIEKRASDGRLSVFLKPSGFTGTDPLQVGKEVNNGHATVRLIGSNGITLDPQGRVTFCAQGDRTVVRLEKDGKRTVLADRYEGKRLNGPNDLVYKSDGALYFTDPSSGFPKGASDPKKELPFEGVFLFKDGQLRLLDKEFTHPNGLALAPGEKQLYVNDTVKLTIMVFDVLPDDSLANKRLLIDMTGNELPGKPDGMKVDIRGNIYCTGPGGVWVVSPTGKHLGTIKTPAVITNLAFGGKDRRTLFLTSRNGDLYSIQLNVAGIVP